MIPANDRPYIFCHMLTSIDGKIMGSYMETPEGEAAGEEFHTISFGKTPFYRHQGWLSGRITTDDNFTDYREPVLDANAPAVPDGDFIAYPNAPMYYVSVDPSGRLGWESSTLHYEEVTAHVLEVLTGNPDINCLGEGCVKSSRLKGIQRIIDLSSEIKASIRTMMNKFRTGTALTVSNH